MTNMSEKDTQVYLKSRIEISLMSLKLLLDLYSKAQTPDADTVRSTLVNLEFLISEISSKTGVSSQTEQEIQQRYQALRQANLRISQLEHQLAQSCQNEYCASFLRSVLQAYRDKLEYWWDMEGFGYLSSVKFTSGGVKVEASCHLMGGFHKIGNTSYMSSTPVTSLENKVSWLQELKDKGYEILEADKDFESSYLLDSDVNRSLVLNTIFRFFPSARIISLSTNFRPQACLDSVSFLITDFQEVQDLQQPENSLKTS